MTTPILAALVAAAISIAAAGIGFLVGLGIGQAVDWGSTADPATIRAIRARKDRP